MGHLAPVVFGVAAAVLVAIALQQRSATTEVPVASGPIAVGAPVNAGNTRRVAVHSGDAGLLAGVLPASSIGAGWVATVPIVAGDPITRSEVARSATGTQGLGAMSIPVPISDADGGAIVAGDSIDVISATTNGPQYVAQGLRVLDVSPATSSSGVLTTSNNNYFVVVAVDRKTALRLAASLAASSTPGNSSGVVIVRTTGEPAASPGGAN